MRTTPRLLALALVIGALCTTAAPPPPTVRFDKAAWLADFQLLKSTLERSYGHLAWAASTDSGLDLPALERRTTQALQRAQSDADAEAALTAFVQGFRDGHFSLTKAPAPGVAAAEPPKRAPDTTAAEACAAFGYSPATRVAFSLPFESLAGFTLTSDGLSRPFRAGTIVVGERTVGIVRIPRFRANEFPALCLDVWASLRSRRETVAASDVSAAMDVAWLSALAARLAEFRAAHVNVVLVDVGGNGGGNDLGDWAVRAFTAQPVHSAPLLMVTGDAGLPYLDEQLKGLREKLQAAADAGLATLDAGTQAIVAIEARKRLAAAPACDLSWVWRERRAWSRQPCRRLVEAGSFAGQFDYAEPGAFDPRLAPTLYWASVADPFRGAWDGPVFVLTDERTASAAEMFAALMHDAAHARVIGVRTMGLGCGFMGAAPPIVLPHSRLSFSIPNCVRLRGDGTDEVAGITPDDVVAPVQGESGRARAMRVLGIVGK